MERRYLFIIALILFPGAVLLACSALILIQVEEFIALETLVNRQQHGEQFCLYHGNHGDELSYKSLSFAERKPSIISLGSSRSMQFRERYFTDSFYAAGVGQASSVARLYDWTHYLLSLHKPEAVILVIDHWWFNTDESENIAPFEEEWHAPKPRIQPRFFLTPLQKFFRGKLTASDFSYALQRRFEDRGYCSIGQQAALIRNGYAADGSYYYGLQLVDRALSTSEQQFANTLSRVRRNTHSAQFDTVAWEKLESIIQSLQEQDIDVLVLLPPMAPMIYTQMEDSNNDYLYIDALRSHLRTLSVPFVDALDSMAYNSSNCEFPDGRHGGDVTYARILQNISVEAPWWRTRIDTQRTKEAINRSSGLSQDVDQRALLESETDFLNIGCLKF